MEIAGPDKGLPNDSRSYNLAILFDELTVGFGRKQHLRQTGDSQRVQKSKHHRRN
jgi:hypothetical protein